MSTEHGSPVPVAAGTEGTPLRPIRQLSQSVINKIAAGEVIERPASVVKELLENSIDAGATWIEVSLRNGGLDSIRVTDNGCGIPPGELLLAVGSHATSKIHDADDLFRVQTFGFRGEALASIAEISQFSLRSRTADSDAGFELLVDGGQPRPIEPCGMPVGSTVTVDNLFFNTPVRRKFLRTSQTEIGHVGEAFTRIALANPGCQLTLLHNGRALYQLAPTTDWSARIHDFFGPEIGEALIPVESRIDGIGLAGFVVDPSVSRSHNRMQYLFLNGRYIRDRSLQHALSEAYRGLLMTGRFPVCFLRLSLPHDLVDVNVHPAKLEVRFQDGGRIYSQLLGTIRNRFLTTDLTSRAQLSRPGAVPAPHLPAALQPAALQPGAMQPGAAGAFAPRDWSTADPLAAHSRALSGGGSTPFAGSGQVPPPIPSPFHQSQIGFAAPAPRNWLERPVGSPALNPAGNPAEGGASDSPARTAALSGWEAGPVAAGPAGSTSPPLPPLQSGGPSTLSPGSTGRAVALQVHNTYLITETEEGMVVIDQHALHERILYEQLREKLNHGSLEVQPLLVPEPVALTSAEAAAVLENAAVLRQIGVEVQPFGGDTILISGYPAMLANHNPAEMLRGVLESLLTPGARPQQRDLLDELLHMIACKAAIKAGDRLTRDEMTALLEHRNLCQDAHHCPHGRPTALVFSREELDRRFKRI